MDRKEKAKLHTIMAKLEALQNATANRVAKERMGTAKNELIRLLNEIGE